MLGSGEDWQIASSALTACVELVRFQVPQQPVGGFLVGVEVPDGSDLKPALLDLRKEVVVGGAVPGALFIGDGLGGPDADVVRISRPSQINSAADVTVSGSGRLEVNASDGIGSISGEGSLVLNTARLTVGYNDASTAFDGLTSGPNSLTKVGSGVLTLTGDNSYTGDTRVVSGTLIVNGLQPASAVTVAGGPCWPNPARGPGPASASGTSARCGHSPFASVQTGAPDRSVARPHLGIHGA